MTLGRDTRRDIRREDVFHPSRLPPATRTTASIRDVEWADVEIVPPSRSSVTVPVIPPRTQIFALASPDSRQHLPCATGIMWRGLDGIAHPIDVFERAFRLRISGR
jgi:hypothetical protein